MRISVQCFFTENIKKLLFLKTKEKKMSKKRINLIVSVLAGLAVLAFFYTGLGGGNKAYCEC